MTVWKLHTVRNRNNSNAEFRLAGRRVQKYIYRSSFMHIIAEAITVARHVSSWKIEKLIIKGHSESEEKLLQNGCS